MNFNPLTRMTKIGSRDLHAYVQYILHAWESDDGLSLPRVNSFAIVAPSVTQGASPAQGGDDDSLKIMT